MEARASSHGTVVVVWEGVEDGVGHGLGFLDLVGGDIEGGFDEVGWAWDWAWAWAWIWAGVEEGRMACLRELGGFADVMEDGSGSGREGGEEESGERKKEEECGGHYGTFTVSVHAVK